MKDTDEHYCAMFEQDITAIRCRSMQQPDVYQKECRAAECEHFLEPQAIAPPVRTEPVEVPQEPETPEECAVPDCPDKPKYRGFCQRHYSQLYRAEKNGKAALKAWRVKVGLDAVHPEVSKGPKPDLMARAVKHFQETPREEVRAGIEECEQAVGPEPEPEQPSDRVTCRECGRSGYALDEFTSPYTGLCAECSGDEQPEAAPQTPLVLRDSKDEQPADNLALIIQDDEETLEAVREMAKDELRTPEKQLHWMARAYLEAHNEAVKLAVKEAGK